MSSSFSLSLELILLIDFLLKNEKNRIKKLVESALKKGFSSTLEEIDNIENNSNELDKLQNSILEFLIFMEDTLLESLENKKLDFDTKEKLNSTIKKIRTNNIDLQTLSLSLQEAKTKFILSKTNLIKNEEIKKVLFSQLLKNWKPKRNEPAN